MASEMDLEQLCRAALAKLGLKLMHRKDCTGEMYIIEVDDAHCKCWTMLYSKMAESADELASRLFKCGFAENAYWWPNFKCVNIDDGCIRTVKNIFAGKSLEEVQVMVDFM